MRQSIYIPGFSHRNPIPNAARVGNLVVSGTILGVDAETGELPPDLAAQCENIFEHMRAIVAEADATMNQIVKVTVWLRDRSNREPLNAVWLRTFPDPASRPARLALSLDPDVEWLVQADFMAMLG